eukprot:TRINITY_DN13031_c0_g1_i1.p1 TRINITY_DN13031_c0_g1~~TRINITY_DN13031_c0_g1_i1.p1  ORF type:complete len:959 (+),score=312.86 TRINITY_DN13031_c0_g1_i1:55-2931(+)
MKLSVKWVTILAMAFCVLCTVTATLVLAVRSTDQAISRTNNQHNASVEACFSTGEENIITLTASLMEENGRVIAAEINRFLSDVRGAHSEILTIMEATPTAEVDQLSSYTKYNALFWSMWMSKSLTLIAVGTPDGGGQMITELQSFQGDFRNEGTTRSLDSSLLLTHDSANGSTFYGTLNSFGGFMDLPCNFDFIRGGFSGPCPGNPSFTLTAVPVVRKGLVFTHPTDRVAADVPVPLQWGKIHSFPLFAGIALAATFESTPKHPNRTVSGFVQVSHDLRSVANVITNHLDGDHVVFVVIGGTNDQLGLVVGTSVGNSTAVVPGIHPITGSMTNVTMPTHCTNVTDAIVQGACRDIYALGGGTMGEYGVDPFQAVYDQQMNTNRTVEVVVDESIYFVRITELSDSIGLKWWIVSIEQKEAILGKINAERNAVHATIEDSTESVNHQLAVDRAVMYLVIFSVVMVMFVISAVGTMILVRPLEHLKKEMEDVARLQLDDLQTGNYRSILTEVSSMQTSFLAMVASMKEYKQYMPQALLQREDEEDINSDVASDDSEDVSHSHKHNTPHGPGTHSETSGSKAKNDSESADHVVTLTGSSGTSPNPALIVAASNVSGGKRKNGLGVYLTKKARVTQLSICCTDFNRYIRTTGDPSAIVEFHSKWLHMCVTDAQDFQGVLVSFIADNVDLSFGGLSNCLSPPTKAAKYALQVRNRLNSIKSELTENTQPAMGLATGTVYVGNLGCTGVKMPAVLGRAVAQSKVTQTIAMEMGLDIVMDQTSADELKGVIICTPVEVIKTEAGNLRVAYFLAEAHHAGAGEWMYTMDVGVGAGEHYDRAWELLRAGQLTQAADFFDTLVESDAAMALAPRIRSYIDDVYALTGSVPIEYARSIRPRGTLPAPISDHCFFSRKISAKLSEPRKRSMSNPRSSTKLSSCASLSAASGITKVSGASPPAVKMLDHNL